MLHHIATRNKNQKQSLSAAPSSIVDVSENVFLMRIQIDKNTGSDFFSFSSFSDLCIYLFFIPPTLCSILSRLWGRGTEPKSFQFISSVMERREKYPLVRFFYAITEQTEIRVTGSLSDGEEKDRRRRVVCCMPSIYTESASLAPGSSFFFSCPAYSFEHTTSPIQYPPIFLHSIIPCRFGEGWGRCQPDLYHRVITQVLIDFSLSLSLFSMGRKEGHRRPGSSLKRSSEYYKLISHTKMRLLPWRPSSSCSFFFPTAYII